MDTFSCFCVRNPCPKFVRTFQLPFIAETMVPDTSHFEAEIATEELCGYESLGTAICFPVPNFLK